MSTVNAEAHFRLPRPLSEKLDALAPASLPAREFELRLYDPPSSALSWQQKAELREAVGEAFEQSEVVQKWRKTYATADGALEALHSDDAALFELILHAMPESEKRKAAADPVFRREVDDAVQSLLEWGKRQYDRPTLEKAGRVAGAMIETIGAFKKRATSRVTTETLIVTLQRAHLGRMAGDLAEKAIRNGIPLKEATVLSTLFEVEKSITSSGQTARFGALAIAALDKQVVNPASEKTVGVYDVTLARLASPELLNTPDRRNLNDRSLMSVVRRMHVAGELAHQIIDSEVAFFTERTVDRLNMTVRGMTTAALGCTASLIKQITPNYRDFHSAVDRYFNLSIEYRPLTAREASPAELQTHASTLVDSALHIANRMLVQKEDGRAFQKYRLQGSTINTLMQAIQDTGMEFDTYTCAHLSALIQKALAIPEVKKKLHSRQLAEAVDSFLDSPSAEAPYAAVSVLAASMRAGFGFRRELIEDVCQIASEHTFSGEMLEAFEYLEEITTRPRRRGRDFAVAPIRNIPLKGGLDMIASPGYQEFKSFLASLLSRIESTDHTAYSSFSADCADASNSSQAYRASG